MIETIPPPFHITEDCRQVCCRFDEHQLPDDSVREWSLGLPKHLLAAATKRKAEYLAGRYCARQAMMQFDTSLVSTAIGTGTKREPLWPEGYVGSITHTQGYASAAVAKRQIIRGLGIDSEAVIGPETAATVRGLILSGHESETLYQTLFDSTEQYLTLVFSAKESLFKCLFPLVGRFFDFQAAEIIELTPAPAEQQGAFRIVLKETLSAEFAAGFSACGVYAAHKDLVHTAIAIRA